MGRCRVRTKDILKKCKKNSGSECKKDAHDERVVNVEEVDDEMDHWNGVENASDEFVTWDVENNYSKSNDKMWSSLSMQDLARVYCLLNTTQSKAAMERYFSVEQLPRESEMKQLLLNNLNILKVKICSCCGNDINRCNCAQGPKNGELMMYPIEHLIRQFLTSKGDNVLQQRDLLLHNSASRENPISQGFLKEKFTTEYSQDALDLYFVSAFDGVKLHKKTNTKCWPFTLLSLNLCDHHRSRDAVLMPAIYVGNDDPSFSVHDRVIKWVLDCFENLDKWRNFEIKAQIVCGTHDDQARRKIYNMKGFRSSGSCFHCLNQMTLRKINDANTILRETVREVVPVGMEDGLLQAGTYPFFHYVCPMYESPVDLFHVLSEGIFDKLITELICKRDGIFGNVQLPLDFVKPSLPSRWTALSGRTSEITGTEKTLIFESVIVPAAFLSRLPPVVSAIVLLLHSIFRLEMSPDVLPILSLHNKVSKLCGALEQLFRTHYPEMFLGSKVHQLCYHLPHLTLKYGSMQPYSTQYHENTYHYLQRSLVSEITNNVGHCILRNVSTLNELRGEVRKRLKNSPELEREDIHARQLADWLKLDKYFATIVKEPFPSHLQSYAGRGYYYTRTLNHRGRRYSACHKNDSHIMFHYISTTQFGRIVGFLCSDYQPTEIVVLPLLITDKHLETLCRSLTGAGLSRNSCQTVISSLSDSSAGAVVTGYGREIILPLSNLIGHSVIVEYNNHSLVIPFSLRCMPS